MRSLLILSVALIAVTVGCKSKEQKLLEESMALHQQAYEILDDNAGDADKAIAGLNKLEEDSRGVRDDLRKKLFGVIKELDEDERKAFDAEAKKRYEEMLAKFASIIKRYPEASRERLKHLIKAITM